MSYFDDLMREVLSMVKERQDMAVSPFRRQLRDQAQKMFPDPGVSQAMDLQRLKNTGATDVQALHNTGATAVQTLKNTGDIATHEVINTGALARQRLVGESQENVAGIQAGASKYGAELGLKGHEATAGAHVTASENQRLGTERLAQAHENVATTMAGTADKDPRTAFLRKTIETDPSLFYDPTRKKELDAFQQSINKFTVKQPEAGSIRGFDKPDTPKSNEELIRPIPVPAAAAPAAPVSAPVVKPTRKSLAQPAPSDPVAVQLAAQREEERKRSRKRLAELMPGPYFGNNVNSTMGY